MKFNHRKLICIANHPKLIINKVYIEKRHPSDNNDIYVALYDKEEYLGIFPLSIFKTIDELRKERINYLL